MSPTTDIICKCDSGNNEFFEPHKLIYFPHFVINIVYKKNSSFGGRVNVFILSLIIIK